METENLKKVKKILDKLKVPFCLEAGTLLLAYRDGRVDETDTDITVLNLDKVMDNIQLFYDEGFVLEHFFNGVVPEVSLRRNGVKLDIWTKKFRDGQAWWCAYADRPIPQHVDEKHFKSFDKLKIWGETWNIPHDVEAYLEANYGDWRIPTTEWNWKTDPKSIDYNWNIKE